MDQSKIGFLQSVLRYTTTHTNQTAQPETAESANREMDQEVCILFTLKKINSPFSQSFFEQVDKNLTKIL